MAVRKLSRREVAARRVADAIANILEARALLAAEQYLEGRMGERLKPLDCKSGPRKRFAGSNPAASTNKIRVDFAKGRQAQAKLRRSRRPTRDGMQQSDEFHWEEDGLHVGDHHYGWGRDD